MKIFIQMSVAGFKVFDVQLFGHECELGRYALMSEISMTQNGEENAHTHIIRNDMHGMRLETMHLFSSNDVNLLLHDDMLDRKSTRCLYVSKYSLTQDKFRRGCDVSLCIMSEKDADIVMVNKLGHMLMIEQHQTVMENLQSMLRLDIIDDKQVLLFDESLWQSLYTTVMQYIPVSSTPMIDGIAQGKTQVVVLGTGQDRVGLMRNMEGLFNNNLYWVLHNSHLPLINHTLSVPDAKESMNFDLPQQHSGQYKTEHHDFHKFLRSFKKIIREI